MLNFLVAAASLGGLFGSNPPPPPPPVPGPALVASPATGVKGTIVMVHGGGWHGVDAAGQAALMQQPGEMFVARGWRVVSVDYDAGIDGLQDVVDAAAAELAAPAGRLLCLYGESAGAHLSLLAAAKLDGVDCVMAAGPPTDLIAYQAEARASGDHNRSVISGLMQDAFGSTPETTALWDPVRVASTIRADVLLLRQAADLAIPREQIDNYLAADPTAQSTELESTSQASTDTYWLHGMLSEAGRAQYLSQLGGFVDREVAAHGAERGATRSGCKGTLRPLSTSRLDRERLTVALGCLARHDDTLHRRDAARAQTTVLRLLGRASPARVWAALRAKSAGRRALAALAARRATTSLKPGSPSRITVRVKR
jgi:hypothetical protein